MRALGNGQARHENPGCRRDKCRALLWVSLDCQLCLALDNSINDLSRKSSYIIAISLSRFSIPGSWSPKQPRKPGTVNYEASADVSLVWCVKIQRLKDNGIKQHFLECRLQSDALPPFQSPKEPPADSILQLVSVQVLQRESAVSRYWSNDINGKSMKLSGLHVLFELSLAAGEVILKLTKKMVKRGGIVCKK